MIIDDIMNNAETTLKELIQSNNDIPDDAFVSRDADSINGELQAFRIRVFAKNTCYFSVSYAENKILAVYSAKYDSFHYHNPMPDQIRPLIETYVSMGYSSPFFVYRSNCDDSFDDTTKSIVASIACRYDTTCCTQLSWENIIEIDGVNYTVENHDNRSVRVVSEDKNLYMFIPVRDISHIPQEILDYKKNVMAVVPDPEKVDLNSRLDIIETKIDEIMSILNGFVGGHNYT